MAVLSQWLFNENTGTSVEDSGTGTDLDLTITTGGGSAWTGSSPHYGYDIAGSFITTPTWSSGAGNKYFDNLNGLKTMTITVVFQIAANPTGQERLIWAFTDSDGSYIFTMGMDLSGSVYIDSAFTAGVANIDGTSPVSTGSRHVVTYRFDSAQATAANRASVYVDGSLVVSNPSSDGIAQNTLIDLNHFAFVNRFCVGCRGDNNSGRRFQGQIYYCDILSDALTGGQITSLHSALATSDDANPYGSAGTSYDVKIGYKIVNLLD